MDTEARLRLLEHHYRVALSASVAAKARYLALLGDAAVLPAALKSARERWKQLETRRREIAFKMSGLEEIEQASTA